MRILYIADGRSPIARSWMEPFILAGDEVHLASTFGCPSIPGLSSQSLLPVAFSGLKGRSHGVGGLTTTIGFGTRLRHYLGPLTVPRASARLDTIIKDVQPDLVHALRVPFEGMVAAYRSFSAPLVVSTWGNDFTLHARGSWLMRRLTRATLAAADGLHADCRRDLTLAKQWGFDERRPAVVLPGNGGLEPVFLQMEPPDLPVDSQLNELLATLDPDAPLVVNPRGLRAYVRNDTFFKSIPLVLANNPATIFACPAMEKAPAVQRWMDDLGIKANVKLLAKLDSNEMSILLRRAQLTVSPSEHDGTPNSMLEAMASGAVPIAGDLESIREWIVDGRNGRLFDPADPGDLAGAIVHSLADSDWLDQAQRSNRKLVQERASRQVVYQAAREFYLQVRPPGPVL